MHYGLEGFNSAERTRNGTIKFHTALIEAKNLLLPCEKTSIENAVLVLRWCHKLIDSVPVTQFLRINHDDANYITHNLHDLNEARVAISKAAKLLFIK